MRIHCFYCSKPVSTELPRDTVFRAIAACPECIEAGKDVEDDDTPDPVNQRIIELTDERNELYRQNAPLHGGRLDEIQEELKRLI